MSREEYLSEEKHLSDLTESDEVEADVYEP